MNLKSTLLASVWPRPSIVVDDRPLKANEFVVSLPTWRLHFNAGRYGSNPSPLAWYASMFIDHEALQPGFVDILTKPLTMGEYITFTRLAFDTSDAIRKHYENEWPDEVVGYDETVSHPAGHFTKLHLDDQRRRGLYGDRKLIYRDRW